jgi:nucleotide-binding universal stress UspA family protein
MFRRLLVALDGSPFAASVVPLTLDLARRADGEVRFVVVTPPPPVSDGSVTVLNPSLAPSMHLENRRYLDDLLAREAGKGVKLSSELLDGPVVDMLADAIRAHDSDLVVLATHGRGGFSRFWLGSTATGLIRQSPAPLLLLRPGEGELLPPLRPKRVLVPVDGSGFGDAIIWDALAFGGTEDVEYHVIQVIPPVPVVLSAASPERDRKSFGEREAAAVDFLATVKDEFATRGAACVTSVLAAENVSEEIMAYADREGCDLIAMGTHGRSGVGRLLIGSVADKVIRGSRVPMLLRGPAA